MKKTMSKIAQINKEELSAQKVELSNTQMLNSIISESNKIYNRGVKFVQSRETLTKEARRLNSDAESLIKGGSKMIAEFKSKAKELGVNPDSLQEFKKAIDALGVMDTIEKQTRGYTKIRS
jgi:ribosomal protein S18